MSMKANELSSRDLMVGDWVMHANGTPMQVKRIVFGHFACAENGGANCWEYNNKFKPIPLTPEILEKNGFKRENLITSYNHYIGIDNRVSLNDDFYYINSRDVWSVHVDSEDYCTIANCELTYLHELQNLLRICKINFEFVV